MNKRLINSFLMVLLLASFSISAMTIAEKKAQLEKEKSKRIPDMDEKVQSVNATLKRLKDRLKEIYFQVGLLYQKKAEEEAFKPFLEDAKKIKKEIASIENKWRKDQEQRDQGEEYGVWQEPDITVEQLILDYAASDYVYLIPQEIGQIQLNIYSNIHIPKASWPEMLELILQQNGVGLKTINPYLKVLYKLEEDHSCVALITNKRHEIDRFPDDSLICYVISPKPADQQRVWKFLETFSNSNTTTIKQIGRDIYLIAEVRQIRNILKLYDFISDGTGGKEYKMVPLTRLNGKEAVKIIQSVFSLEQTKDELSKFQAVTFDNVSRAVFLVGTAQEIKKAEEIIWEVEHKVGKATEKVVYWYTAKHSEPEELAELLGKVYGLMVKERCVKKANEEQGCPTTEENGQPSPEVITDAPLYDPGQGFYQGGTFVVNPTPVVPQTVVEVDPNQGRENFFVDPKTGSILMVVEPEILPRLKEVIRKVDVPKKMVQIEVLLFEKKMTESNKIGLNLLKIGSKASQTRATSLVFNEPVKGLTEFMISRPEHGDFPAFDLTYNFLLSQEDIQINASPSITTMNQTPARIAIVEDISISTGVFEVETAKGITLKDGFTRAQYGTILTITPTIHMRDDSNEFFENEEECDYITLETDITFDTVQANNNDRPDVTRRSIKNKVRVPNGQALILGGLRRKNTTDKKDSIPFIGEIPFLGKLFSETELSDSTTEMFIFITPRIIEEPCQDIEKMKRLEMCRRPGDIPEYLCELAYARRLEKQRIMEGGLKMIFGRRPDRCYDPYSCER